MDYSTRASSAAAADSAFSPHDLDAVIQRLLDQQADLQARLSGLYVARYGFDARQELDMLRHKVRTLEIIADGQGKFSCCPIFGDFPVPVSLCRRNTGRGAACGLVR